MRNIGTVITFVAEQTELASPAPRSSMPALPAKRDPDGLPVRLDKECDVELPRQLFAAWFPDTGRRAIVRALSVEERAKIQARATALEECRKYKLKMKDIIAKAGPANPTAFVRGKSGTRKEVVG